MRTAFTSLLACICLAASTDATPVYDPASVVQVVIMGDKPNIAFQIGGIDLDAGSPTRPTIDNPFMETINVRRPFDELNVTSPNAGPLEIIKVKDGKRFRTAHLVRPDEIRYAYGDFMILRLRKVSNVLVKSIRASPTLAEELGLKMTHTISNTKVSSISSTESWETEATVTGRAEASGTLFGFGGSVSGEFSATVRRSVSTTFESSDATTVVMSTEESFTLKAPPGNEAALWMSRTQIDVYVCTTGVTEFGVPKLFKTQPLNSNCKFSHSVTEDGKLYEVTVTPITA